MSQPKTVKELIDQGYKICYNGRLWCRLFAGLMFGFMCGNSLQRKYPLVVFDLAFFIAFIAMSWHFNKRLDYWKFRRIEENSSVKED